MARGPLNNEEFDRIYSRLNKEQKEAVDTIEGPVMVIAGPGTGKTQILTLRIANILRRTDTDPEAILALTFTESGVISMRRRLAEIIGSRAYETTITTFHGFANEIIGEYPEEFPRIIGSVSITEVDQIRVFERVLKDAKVTLLRPFGDPYFYLRPALNAINELKREGVSPERFQDIIEQKEKEFNAIPDLYYEKGAHKGKMKGAYQEIKKRLERNKELAILYADYEKALRENKFYDYSDMIMEVFGVLQRNRDLLLTLQEKHQYFLVDEHQDTNNAQNRILELLASYYESPNLFVVGDEKQAIFRFQGASLENFHYFRNLYPQAKLITLTQNYRSTQTILDTARSLRKESPYLEKTAAYPERQITLYEFSRPEAEYYFLAKNVKEYLDHGGAPEEVAVLFRDNRDALPIARMFEKFGIPFVIESDRNILVDPDIKKLIALVRAAVHYGDDGALLEAMHIDFLRIDPLDLYKIADKARSEKQSAYALIASSERLDELQMTSKEAVLALSEFLKQASLAMHNRGVADALEYIIRESGFLKYVLGLPDHLDKLDKVSALSDELRKLIENHKDFTLAAFLEYIDMLYGHDVLIRSSGMNYSLKRVRLMTGHRSKGLEFERVYITNLFDTHWGNRRRVSHFELPKEAFSLRSDSVGEGVGDENEDERNLFYVALTRAKREIVLSYSKTAPTGREQLPSQFLEEIDPQFIESGDAKPYESEFESGREIVFAAPIISAPDIKNKEFVRDLFMRYGLSVTALNNYLECPWKYFYRNLVRIPEAPQKQLMYGIAIHCALKDFFDRWREGEDPGEAFLAERFAAHLLRQPLEKRDYEAALPKGEMSLRGYYQEYRDKWARNLINEFGIRSVELASDIRLTGVLDKIEILDSANRVNVVDYKTGKPQSRAMIEGLTKSSEGNYKRQLVFYRLLLERYADGKYRMASGDVDFVEPDDKGRYKKERFEIMDEEVKDLMGVILKVASEILNLEFWDKTCDDKDCKYCELRKLMA